MAILRTTNLTIRLCELGDKADFIALENDREVMRFLTGGKVGIDVRSELADTFLRPRGTEPFVWTARHSETADFVGWFCLWPEDGRIAELGYRLRRSEWGKGLASEGAFALVFWGFRTAGYDMITASTMAINFASRRVLEKMGFTLTRTTAADWAALIPGGEHGEVHYELQRMVWSESRRAP